MTAYKGPKVTVRRDFECMYIVDRSKSDPDNPIELNAHRYRFEVSVTRYETANDPVVVEFSDLQTILGSMLPDGYYIYNPKGTGVPTIVGTILKNAKADCKEVDFELCAENICTWLVIELQKLLDKYYPSLLRITDAILRENSQCYVSWHIGENDEN